MASRAADVARGQGRPVCWLRGSSEAALRVDLLLAAEAASAAWGARWRGGADRAIDEGPALVVVDDLVDPDLLAPYLLDWAGGAWWGAGGDGGIGAAAVEVLVTTGSDRARRLGPVRRAVPLGAGEAERLLAARLGRTTARQLAPGLRAGLRGRPLGLRLAAAVLARRGCGDRGGDRRRARAVADDYLARVASAPNPLTAAVEAALAELGGPATPAGRLLRALVLLGPSEPSTAAAAGLDGPGLDGAGLDGARLDGAGTACSSLVELGLVELVDVDPVGAALVGLPVGRLRLPAAVRAAVGSGRPGGASDDGAVDLAADLLAAELALPGTAGTGPVGTRVVDVRPWLPSVASLAEAAARTGRPSRRARRVAEAALDRLAPALPAPLLLPLHEARARMLSAGLGSGDVAAWPVRRALAAARVNAGQAAQAVTDFAALVEEVGPALGPGHPDTLLNHLGLGVALLEAGRSRAAVEVLERVVPALATACGPGDPATRRAVRHRAAARLALGRADEAVADLRALDGPGGPPPDEAVADLRALDGPGGPPPGESVDERWARGEDLVVALLAAGRPAEALAELDRLVDVDGPGRPCPPVEGHPEPRAARDSLTAPGDTQRALRTRRLRGSALVRLGRIDEAVAVLEAVARRLDQWAGPGSADALAAWSELIVAYDAADRAIEAAGLAERLAPRCRQALGPAHALTLAAAARAGAARLHRQDRAAAIELLAPLVEAIDEIEALDPVGPVGPVGADPNSARTEIRRLLAVATVATVAAGR